MVLWVSFSSFPARIMVNGLMTTNVVIANSSMCPWVWASRGSQTFPCQRRLNSYIASGIKQEQEKKVSIIYYNGEREMSAVTVPGKEAVVSGVIFILELDNIQLRVIIFTGLGEGMEIYVLPIKTQGTFCNHSSKFLPLKNPCCLYSILKVSLLSVILI